jgi:hypothetical protein
MKFFRPLEMQYICNQDRLFPGPEISALATIWSTEGRVLVYGVLRVLRDGYWYIGLVLIASTTEIGQSIYQYPSPNAFDFFETSDGRGAKDVVPTVFSRLGKR